MYVLSIASLFYLFNTAMFCGNTRGKLPENQQLRKGKETGLHKLKPKDSTLQPSRMVALEYNHTKDLKKKKGILIQGQPTPTISHSSNCTNIGLFDSLIILLTKIKIKLKTKSDLFIFLILAQCVQHHSHSILI